MSKNTYFLLFFFHFIEGRSSFQFVTEIFFSTFAGISVKQNCFFPTFLGCISVSSKAHNKTKLKKMKFSKFLVRFWCFNFQKFYVFLENTKKNIRFWFWKNENIFFSFKTLVKSYVFFQKFSIFFFGNFLKKKHTIFWKKT